MTIIILDTEGLLSLEESGSIFDNQMVTMAVLSSNVVIANHKGEISSNLEGLIGMSLYAKIQIQSSPFKPKLLFVLRDQTQRDMKIFQQQLNRLKDNIQINGQFLQMSIDDELEIRHVILMSGAFTEDMNHDYDIVQKWRTETIAEDIHKLRTTVFTCLEEQMNEIVNNSISQQYLSNSMNSRKNFGAYLYSKLTTNWKSIDELGEGLLRCQSLYELSVQNELKSIAGSIISERQQQLQKKGSQLILTLINTNNLQKTDQLKPHIWVQKIIREGNIALNQIINEEIEEARNNYDEHIQQTYFNRVKSQWENIEASIKNMQQYLTEQLEIRAWETALKINQDYYRQELFNIKITSKTSNECITRLNNRVEELKIEITNSLQTYKRNKEDIIKSILDVYKNIIKTKNINKHRCSTYSICPPLDYTKYLQTSKQLDVIINKYVIPYIKQTEQNNLPPFIIDSQSSFFLSNQDNRSVLKWFDNCNDSNKIEHTLHFVFSELLPRINKRLDMSPLNLSYSDPKMIDELIEIIDYEVNSVKLDMNHINKPIFIQDLIIFMLYLFHEKTNQRFELKNKQLLNDTFNELNQIKENVLDQINQNKNSDNQAILFRRILGKNIIREIERLYRHIFLEEINMKISQYCLIDSTDITRQIYFESITSKSINPINILKFIFDPNHYCFEKVYSIVRHLFQQFIHIYCDEINTKVVSCMLLSTDIVLSNKWTDIYVLHKEILQQMTYALPGFHASRSIEVDQKIENPEEFQEYFKNLQLYDGETDDILLELLTKVQDEFIQISSLEYFESLLYRSIGCTSRCPGCGVKCELPANTNPLEKHHHSSQYHLPMAFNGWPRNEQLNPCLYMCYQQWTNKTIFHDDDNSKCTPKEFFSSEAPDWYNDVEEKSKKGEACSENYPLVEHRRAWMAVRYKLIKEFGLRDQDSYHSGIYPMSIVSIPNDVEVLWKPL